MASSPGAFSSLKDFFVFFYFILKDYRTLWIINFSILSLKSSFIYSFYLSWISCWSKSTHQSLFAIQMFLIIFLFDLFDLIMHSGWFVLCFKLFFLCIFCWSTLLLHFLTSYAFHGPVINISLYSALEAEETEQQPEAKKKRNDKI